MKALCKILIDTEAIIQLLILLLLFVNNMSLATLRELTVRIFFKDCSPFGDQLSRRGIYF